VAGIMETCIYIFGILTQKRKKKKSTKKSVKFPCFVLISNDGKKTGKTSGYYP
jgi:hypothetical protein